MLKQGEYEEATLLANEAEKIYKNQQNKYGLFEIDNIKIDLLYKSGNIDELYQTTKNMVQSLTEYTPDNQGTRRLQRAENAAYVNEQNKVVEQLSQNNEAQKQQIDYSPRLLTVKNNYLTVMIAFCASLFILLIWLFYLLKRVHKLANTDSLTGIRNRRSGIDKTTRIIKKARSNRQTGEIAIAMLDLDNFKLINDTYGHDVGDKVIKNAVNKAKNSLDAQDIICRLGGEEFLIVLNNKTHQQISAKIEQIRIDIYQSDIAELGIISPISASIGITNILLSDESKQLTEYLIDADSALYVAKK